MFGLAFEDITVTNVSPNAKGLFSGMFQYISLKIGFNNFFQSFDKFDFFAQSPMPFLSIVASESFTNENANTDNR